MLFCQKASSNHYANVNYQGRYIKRPPISDSKLKHYDGNNVIFKYLDHKILRKTIYRHSFSIPCQLWGLRAEVDAQDRSIWLENQLTENCANFYDYDYDDDDYDLRIFCFEEGPDGEEIECDDIEADIGEIPWQANLVMKSNRGHFCGGTLLYDRFVLTAAHCFRGERPEEILVILGDHNTDNNDDPYETEYDVRKIIIHPEYFKGDKGSVYQLHNDIALLQLTEPVRMTKGIKNACLPKEEPKNGAAFNMLISGWGKTPKSSYSDILLRTEVNFIPRKYCEEIFRKPNENSGKTGNITERMICAASPGRDACQGDSGGIF